MKLRHFIAIACGFVVVLQLLVIGGSEKTVITITSDATATVDALNEGLCSWQDGGTDASTIQGDDYAFTPGIYVTDGKYAPDKSVAGDSGCIGDTDLEDAAITSDACGTNGIVINDSAYTVSNTEVSMNASEEDGTTSCDFTGKGAALAVYGDSDVVVTESMLSAEGVANTGLFVDNGASVLLESSSLFSAGGTIYEGYVNTPERSVMVAPPWVLGITGTSRGSNIVGNESTLTVVDSDTFASDWAVLSTDSGENMVLNVVNSSLTLTGSDVPILAEGLYGRDNPYTDCSGYGTYVIGNAVETFLGVTMDVGTYASIFTGGSAYYGNLISGETYELKKADNSIHTTYTARKDVQTVINSDTFGFMAHQDGNDIVLDGIEVNSGFSSFVIKSGTDNDITVKNGTTLNPGNGILLQLMDNDDSTTEFDPDTMTFGETHEEYRGFPSEAAKANAADDAAGDISASGDDSTANTTTFTVKDNELTGDLFNGIGWNDNDFSAGNVKQMVLNVNLCGGAVLNGAIASTSCIHATYDGQIALKEAGITAFDDLTAATDFADKYQATSFPQSEYFNIGQVANMVKSNGLNNINVVLEDDAVWNVTGTSLIDNLTIGDDATVVIPEGVTLTVGEHTYTCGTYMANDF